MAPVTKKANLTMADAERVVGTFRAGQSVIDAAKATVARMRKSKVPIDIRMVSDDSSHPDVGNA